MASVNKCIFIGNLGKDPESRSFSNGGTVCNFSIATTDKWKDKETGEPRERTEWINIAVNGRLAEIAQQYLKKGSPVYVEGSLRTRKWQDKEGNDRYTTEIVGHSIQLLGSKPESSSGQSQPRQTRPPVKESDGFDAIDDDIPF